MHSLLLQHPRRLLLLGVAFLCTTARRRSISHAYTHEPPGHDPISIEAVRTSDAGVVLTINNFDESTNGKLVFLKFYSPHCPHCKSISAAWDDLAYHYRRVSTTNDGEDENDDGEDNANRRDDVVIGSIDCSDSPGGGKDLCVRFEIIGLPTLLYGDASLGGIYLEEYGGDKTFEDMKSFAAEALVPTCNPGRLDACPSDTRMEMEGYMSMSYHALDDRIKDMEKAQEGLRASFKDMFAVLQKKYDECVKEKETRISTAKANMRLIQEIMATKG